MNYGAVGNGTTDDTTAVPAAFTAAAAHNGTVDLGHYSFLTSSPIPVYSGLHVRGSAWMGGQNSVGGGTIINNTTDMFQFTTGNFADVTFEDCWLYSGTGGGHIWGVQGVVHTGCTFSNVTNTNVVNDPAASTADVGKVIGGNGNWTNGTIVSAVNGTSYTVSGVATQPGTSVAITIGSQSISNVKILNVTANQT